MASVQDERLAREVEVGGVRLELFEFGSGKPILVLHEGQGFSPDAAFVGGLAKSHRVIAPSHPGFGRSERPGDIDTVDDLAHLYLEFIHDFGLHEVTVLGFSLGGWIAAEVATRCSHDIGRLVLVDAVGIRPGEPTDRPILDIFGVPPEVLFQKTFAHPERHIPDFSTFGDDDFLTLARNREATAVYGWDPYMHNPKLQGRLARLRIPTLVVWGEDDGIVSVEYGRTLAGSVPDGRFVTIPDAGHLPHLEQPDVFVGVVEEFLGP